MLQVMNSFVEGHSQNFLLKYLPKESKLGQPLCFVIWLNFVTPWHTSKIFESNSNNLKLFFSMFVYISMYILFHIFFHQTNSGCVLFSQNYF